MEHDWVSRVDQEVAPELGPLGDVVAVVPEVLVGEEPAPLQGGGAGVGPGGGLLLGLAQPGVGWEDLQV